jgi:hypothetical protein
LHIGTQFGRAVFKWNAWLTRLDRNDDGVRFKEVKKVLEHHGILFVADEVQSGFGRTGKMFAVEHFGVEPDIIVTAKVIADGFP